MSEVFLGLIIGLPSLLVIAALIYLVVQVSAINRRLDQLENRASDIRR